jgi:hypothetical protein
MSDPTLFAIGQTRRRRAPLTHFLDAADGVPYCRLVEARRSGRDAVIAAAYRQLSRAAARQVDCPGCTAYLVGKPDYWLAHQPFLARALGSPTLASGDPVPAQTPHAGSVRTFRHSFRHLRPGDQVARILGGAPMTLTVTAIDAQYVYCGPAGVGWKFDRDHGIEVDEDLGWGPQFGVVGSYLRHPDELRYD